jgi:peroxiredoxin
VAAISYDAPAVLSAFAQQRGITFPLLSDADSATIRQFGLVNPAVEWGLGPDRDDSTVAAEVRRLVSAAGRAAEMMRGMALPGTLMLDRRGRVTARFFEDFYVDRNTVASVLVRVGSGDKPVSATRVSSEQVELTSFVSDTEVAPGNRVSIVLDVVPKKGMHVYAPGAAGYKVIGLRLDEQPFVKPLPMIYPASEIYHFKPLNERVPVFQKAVRLTQDVLIEGTAQAQAAWRDKTVVTLSGTVEYQACDDKVCYNPVSAPVSFNVALKRLITERIK